MKRVIPDDVKRAAIHFMRRGQMSASDVALLAGVDRETARRWALERKIDCDALKSLRLQRLWRARIMSYRSIGVRK